MEKFVASQDGTPIFYRAQGRGRTGLVFVHGWMGHGSWWDAQREAFAADYLVVQVDLAGHGRSGRDRTIWSVAGYAADIEAVVADLPVDRVILVGHSMSGANVLEAAAHLGDRVQKVILIDTLHDLDRMLKPEEVQPLMDGLRRDFAGTIEFALHNYLLVPTSPEPVRDRLRREFLAFQPERSAELLNPFYSYDIRPSASQVKAPVRALNALLVPTSEVNNSRYMRGFAYKTMDGVGHYPMLEDPARFNALLVELL